MHVTVGCDNRLCYADVHGGPFFTNLAGRDSSTIGGYFDEIEKPLAQFPTHSQY